MPFPGPLSRFDTLGRADGAAHAGAGAAIWQDTFLGGAASGLIVTDNQLAVGSGDTGALTVAEETDSRKRITFGAVSGFVSWFARITDEDSSDWEAVWFLAEGGTWQIRERVDEAQTQLAVANVESLSNEAVIIDVQGTTFRVYREGLEDPVLEATTSITGEGPSCLNLGSTDTRVLAIEDADPDPAGPATLWVDADHPDATDDLYRDEASESTPFATPAGAARRAWATPEWGDEIPIKAAANANPSDTVDSRMYPPVGHVINADSSPSGVALPLGDNTGNEPIVMYGVPVDLGDGPEPPIMRGVSGNGLRNWQFGKAENGRAVPGTGWQQGYDRGLEVDGIRQDVRGLSKFQRCADLAFYGIHFTSGAWRLNVWSGDITMVDCEVNAPLPANPNTGSFDGNGLGGTDQGDDRPGDEHAGRLIIRHTILRDIRGNDAIQVGQGEFFHAGDAAVIVEDSVFVDVIADGEFHTDAIQILGCPDVQIRRTGFYGCTNVLIGSDFRNGTVLVENCCSYGGTPIQIQGTNELTLWHNTFLRSDFADSTVILFTRAALPAPMRLTMVNNIIGGIFWRDATARTLDPESVISHNLVMSNPGGTTQSTPSGTHLPGLPEFGLSDRMDTIGWPEDNHLVAFAGAEILPAFELANTPNVSPGIGQGVTLDGMPEADMLGRAFAENRDVGCFQGDPGTLVSPVPRPPYIMSRTPPDGATGVSSTVSPELVLYPKPGEWLVVPDGSVTMAGQEGGAIPVLVTVSEPDENGEQAIKIDPKVSLSPEQEGELLPLATYTVALSDAIEDTEGSAIVATSSSFRVAGIGGPAITGGSGVPVEPTTGDFVMGGVPWLPGTTVKVWPARAYFPGASNPSGPAIAQATVSDVSSLSFEGLPLGVRLVAFAEGRAVGFMVPPPVYKTIRVQ